MTVAETVDIVAKYEFIAIHHILDHMECKQPHYFFIIFIAPAYSRVRYRSPNFCPSIRSSVRSFVRSFVRPSTFTLKFGFLDINDSCESQTLHSNCP